MSSFYFKKSSFKLKNCTFCHKTGYFLLKELLFVHILPFFFLTTVYYIKYSNTTTFYLLQGSSNKAQKLAGIFHLMICQEKLAIQYSKTKLKIFYMN